MPRRVSNIYKRKDGRWEGRYPLEKPLHGKRKYRSIYGKSYTEVKAGLEQAIKNAAKPLARSNCSFAEVLDAWMESHSISQKPSTKLKYDNLINTHIKPDLGTYSIEDIDEVLISRFIQKKMKHGRLDGNGGLSPSYLTTILLIIQSSLKYAVCQELCTPLKSPIQKPILSAKEISVINTDDLHRLEAGLLMDDSLVSLGMMLSLNAGLRIGEVCALRWEDVDLPRRVIHIRHSVIRVRSSEKDASNSCFKIGDPKTLTSYRDLPITNRMNEMFVRYEQSAVSEYVVSDHHGFLSPRTYEYRFHRKLDDYGIPQTNYHTLRHTFATRCIEQGVDIKSLSEMLGHKNVNITLNTYVHSSMSRKRELLENIT